MPAAAGETANSKSVSDIAGQDDDVSSSISDRHGRAGSSQSSSLKSADLKSSGSEGDLRRDDKTTKLQLNQPKNNGKTDEKSNQAQIVTEHKGKNSEQSQPAKVSSGGEIKETTVEEPTPKNKGPAAHEEVRKADQNDSDKKAPALTKENGAEIKATAAKELKPNNGPVLHEEVRKTDQNGSKKDAPAVTKEKGGEIKATTVEEPKPANSNEPDVHSEEVRKDHNGSDKKATAVTKEDGGDTTTDTSSDIGSIRSSRSGARPLVYMYSPPRLRLRGDGGGGTGGGGAGGIGRSKSSLAVKVRSNGSSSKSATTVQQKPALAAVDGKKKSDSQTQQPQPQQQQQRKLKQQERNQPLISYKPLADDGGKTGSSSDADVGNKENKSRAQSARANSSGKKSEKRGRSNSSSSSSDSSRSRSRKRSRSRSHSRSRSRSQKRQRSAEPGGPESNDPEAKSYTHQLKQARTELLTARDEAIKKLTKPDKEKRLHRRSRHQPKLLGTMVSSPSYSDTKIIDANLKKDQSRSYYPVFRGTSSTLVDPWRDLALEKRLKRMKRHDHDQRPSQSRQTQRRNPSRCGSSAHREASSSSRGHQRRDGETADEQKRNGQRQDGKGTAEYTHRPVYFDELPEIRSRIRATRSARASRHRDADYASAADEYRRCLDNLPDDESDDVDNDRRDSKSARKKSGRNRHGTADGRRSRRSMAMSCSAYLSSTPGSRAAVEDCIRHRQRPAASDAAKDKNSTAGNNGVAKKEERRRGSVRSDENPNRKASDRPNSASENSKRHENNEHEY